MKVAIVGCGAMGSVYAGLFSATGNDVMIVDGWREHVEAICERGLRVEGASGDRVVYPRAFTEAPAEVVDLVIIAAKAAQTIQAASQALCMLDSHTVVLTIQNGLGSADSVATIVGEDRLAVGIAAAFGASLRGPGHAHHNAMAAVRMGAYAGLAAERVQGIASAWRAAGFTAEAVDSVSAMQWDKLICNVAYSAPCALTGLTVGQVMEDVNLGALSRSAAVEAYEVARALGIPLGFTDPVAHVLAFGKRVHAAKPSVLLDHENGRASEIEFINGAVPREAAKCAMQAPVNATLTALVKHKEATMPRKGIGD